MSLNETLASLGLTTAPAGNGWSIGCKHILNQGTVIFTGDSVEVWAWLSRQEAEAQRSDALAECLANDPNRDLV